MAMISAMPMSPERRVRSGMGASTRSPCAGAGAVGTLAACAAALSRAWPGGCWASAVLTVFQTKRGSVKTASAQQRETANANAMRLGPNGLWGGIMGAQLRARSRKTQTSGHEADDV